MRFPTWWWVQHTGLVEGGVVVVAFLGEWKDSGGGPWLHRGEGWSVLG